MKPELKLNFRAFLDGVGSILDPFMKKAGYFSLPKSPKSDAEAIAEDWNATGNDLRNVLYFQSEYQTKLEQKFTVCPQIDMQMKLWYS